MEKESRLEIGETLSSQLLAILESNTFSAREISEMTEISVNSIYRWSKTPTARTYLSQYKKIQDFCNKHLIETLTLQERENIENLALFTERIDLTYEEEQELVAKFNQPMRYENAITQLQGIAFAVKFDNEVDGKELKMIVTWLKHNHEFVDYWPISDVFRAFKQHCSAEIDKAQLYKNISTELLGIFEKLDIENDVVTDIYDMLTDEDVFTDKSIVVTGTFKHAKRDDIEQALHNLGNRLQSKVSSLTDYVFVGNKGSRSWRFGQYGRKIEDAIYERKLTGRLKIINEEDTLKICQM